MKNKNYLVTMENMFLALADKTRLRLLNLMRSGEVCVCFFVEVLEESQPKISRHLAYLRNAEVIKARRDGKWMHYKIVNPENEYAALTLRNTLDWLESQEKMREDYRKLESICCSIEVPINIARAPKPKTFAEANTNIRQNRELETFLL